MSKNIYTDSSDEDRIKILDGLNGVTDNEKPIVCDEAKVYFQVGSTFYFKEFGMITEYELARISKYSCVIVAKKAINGGKQQKTLYPGDIGNGVFFRKKDCSMSKAELSRDAIYKYYIGSAEIKKKREELEKRFKDYEPDEHLNVAKKKEIIKSYWEKRSFDEDRKFIEEYPRGCYARMDFDTELTPFYEEPIGKYYNKIYISKDPEYTLRSLSGRTVWQVEAGMYRPIFDETHAGCNISSYQDSGIVVDWRAPIASIYYDNDNEHTEMNVPSKGVSYKHSLMLKRRLPKNGEFENRYIEGGRRWGQISKSDAFLEKTLAERKSSHMLEDIIETIQKNQNELIRNVKLDTDLVVQGCAGSGKTMVLLHRASVLMYNNPNIARANYDIITPNKLFDAHINELAERIKLDDVRRRTTEEVYFDILACFDEKFRNQKEPLPDSRAEDAISAFIYSDEFKKSVEDCIPDIREDIAAETIKGIDLFRILEVSDKHELNVEIPIPKNKEKKSRQLEKCYEFQNAIIKKLEELATISAGYTSIVKAANKDKALIAELYSKKRGMVSPDSKDSEDKLDIMWLAGYLSSKKKKQIFKLMLENQNRDENLNTNYVVKLNSKTTFDEVYSILTELNIDCPTLQKEYIARKIEYSSGNVKSYADCVRDLQKKASEKGINWEVVKRFPAVSGREDLEYVRASLADAKERQANPNYKEYFERYYKAILKNKFDSCADSEVYKSTLYAETLFCDRILKGIETTATPKGLNFALGKYVFVDEGQDLSINEYKLIDSLFGDRVFNIFGDVKQLIKNGYGIDDWDEFKQIRSRVVFGELSENFRNTKNITKYCNSMLGRKDKAVGPDGEEVLSINEKDALPQIDKRVLEAENSEERVAIIVHSIDDVFARTCLSRYNDLIAVNDIHAGKVSLLTVEASKGIEFDRVFVCDNGMSVNERYIAYTRALSSLYVVRK